MSESKCCCCGSSKEKFVELEGIFAKYQGVKGSLIPVLQEAQNTYGYLSKEVLECIAEKLDIPVSQIYGVVTFYSQFHLNPRGKKYNTGLSGDGLSCQRR